MTRTKRMWNLIKTAATRAGEVLAEEAPTLLAVRRDTPIPVLALAAFRVWRRLSEKKRRGELAHWACGAWHVQRAILHAAVQLQVGEPITDRGDGVARRRVGRCSFGMSAGEIALPTGGSIDDFLACFWRKIGGCAIAAIDGEYMSLVPARAACPEPSARVREIASDCARLRAAGHRVGLLLDGQPGSGKSEALRYVAAQLGGRVLRMNLGENGTAAAEFVRHIRPDAVIIDDIDRMETSHALDAVDQILGAGAAVLASSNTKAEICAALLRSGRIDLHHEFGACDPDLLEALTAHLEPPERSRLIGHTVATVVRHNEIAATLGRAKAAAFVASVALSGATSAGVEPGPGEA